MACLCRETPHRQSCPEGQRLQARWRRLAEEADAVRERRATGHRQFRSVHSALRWFYRTGTAWASPKALPLAVDDGGTGAPNRGADDPKRRAWAAVAYGIKLAADEARPLPLTEWIGEHHGAGRPYWSLAEESGRSVDVVKKCMAQAHRLMAERLRDGGWIQGASEREEAAMVG